MSSYRLARLTFPPELSKATADDIVATAAELGGDRWSARQSFDLIAYGLRTRGRFATDGRRDRYWAQGIGFGLITLFLARGMMWGLHLSGLAAFPDGWGDLPKQAVPVISAVLVITILIRSTRAWALLAVGLIEGGPLLLWVITDETREWSTLEMRHSFAFNATIAVGLFLLHRFGDGRPAGSAPMVLAAAITAALPAVAFGDLTLAMALAPLALAVFGVAAIRVDPRWAMGAATLVLYNLLAMLALGLTDVITLGLIAVAGMLLAMAHRSAGRVVAA